VVQLSLQSPVHKLHVATMKVSQLGRQGNNLEEARLLSNESAIYVVNIYVTSQYMHLKSNTWRQFRFPMTAFNRHQVTYNARNAFRIGANNYSSMFSLSVKGKYKKVSPKSRFTS